ncbi:MAG: DUF4276 family protein [Clostridiales bacterium]|nr:DUF4276 family protein [Clostridiales bacterium]
MKNVYIYCEGPTEESFINEILYPYFFNNNIVVYPIICTTKRTPAKKFKGGVSDYAKIKRELILLCKSHHNEYVTTMFDYYAMPNNTPGMNNNDPDIFARTNQIEKAIEADIGEQNCMFHFMLHEFEGVLFSNPTSFSLIANNDVVASVQTIRDSYQTPEHINSSPQTAPSKRLEALIPHYAKIKNGTLLARDMGIDIIIQQCPHFREWIQKILLLK